MNNPNVQCWFWIWFWWSHTINKITCTTPTGQSMFFTLILRNLHLKRNSTWKELSIVSSITKFTFLMKFSLLRKRLQMMNLTFCLAWKLIWSLQKEKTKLSEWKHFLNYIFRKECKLSKLVAILKPRWKMLPEMNVSRNFES